MAAGSTIKHKRKAGAFIDGELAAGEWGLDVTNTRWYFSTNGTTVVATATSGVDTANSPNANEFARFTDADTIEGRTAAETKSDLSLDNVTNESKATMLTNPALTGTPTAPTAAANTNTTQIATTAYVQTEINDLIAAAPGALDTLDELAAALGDDASFASTVTTALSGKAATSHNHAASDINSGDIATARMQTNVVASLNAGGGTVSGSGVTIDGGTL